MQSSMYAATQNYYLVLAGVMLNKCWDCPLFAGLCVCAGRL